MKNIINNMIYILLLVSLTQVEAEERNIALNIYLKKLILSAYDSKISLHKATLNYLDEYSINNLECCLNKKRNCEVDSWNSSMKRTNDQMFYPDVPRLNNLYRQERITMAREAL